MEHILRGQIRWSIFRWDRSDEAHFERTDQMVYIRGRPFVFWGGGAAGTAVALPGWIHIRKLSLRMLGQTLCQFGCPDPQWNLPG